MALLGKPLLVLLSILTVGLPAATYWLWARLPARRVTRVGSRVLLLVGCQLAAVMLVAAAMNDYGYFYSSWSDLIGSTVVVPSAPRPQVVGGVQGNDHAGPTLRSDRTAVHVLQDPGWSTPAQWRVRGRVVKVRIDGARSALSGTASVWLPPQYFDPAQANHDFPAVEVFSGYPGNETQLISRMQYPQHLLAEITAHRAAPMVLVMQRPAVTFPRDTECTDVPAGPQALTYFSQDVPAAIAAAFRVRPTGWGAMGDSTGGYCAAKIAMMHSDVIPAAAVLSGYFHTLRDNTTGDLWGGSSELRKLNDLEWRLAHLPAPPASLFVAISRTEGGQNGYMDTQKFLSLVRPPLQVQTMFQSSGGHNFSSWSHEMGPGLDFLSARLSSLGTARVPATQTRQPRVSASSARAIAACPAPLGWSPSAASSCVGLAVPLPLKGS
ncbi:MAG: esterase family protein [Phycicoccus sp.]|nr:esterase family protein [Phycicoccus sp.]NMM33960.1 esterase family protein [Phycicoccus sp.]